MLCSMALPSKLCSALHRQFNVGSMCDCMPCRSLNFSVLVEILSVVDSDHGTAVTGRNSPQSVSFPVKEWAGPFFPRGKSRPAHSTPTQSVSPPPNNFKNHN